MRVPLLPAFRLGAVLLTALAAPAVALGDTALESTVPRDGAILDRVPTRVIAVHEGRLGRVENATATMDGRDALRGAAHLDPSDSRRLIVPIADRGAGTYEVTWTVLASDAHPLDGSVTFRVRAQFPGAVLARAGTAARRAAAAVRSDVAPA